MVAEQIEVLQLGPAAVYLVLFLGGKGSAYLTESVHGCLDHRRCQLEPSQQHNQVLCVMGGRCNTGTLVSSSNTKTQQGWVQNHMTTYMYILHVRIHACALHRTV